MHHSIQKQNCPLWLSLRIYSYFVHRLKYIESDLHSGITLTFFPKVLLLFKIFWHAEDGEWAKLVFVLEPMSTSVSHLMAGFYQMYCVVVVTSPF